MKPWVLIALAVFAAIPFYWMAGSAHFSACIERANAQYPSGIGEIGGAFSFTQLGAPMGETFPVAGLADKNSRARGAALKKCSHFPI